VVLVAPGEVVVVMALGVVAWVVIFLGVLLVMMKRRGAIR
jgi:hypothetical protein